MAAAISHCVGGRRTAHNLAACTFDRSIVQPTLWLAEIHPVMAALLKNLAPTQGDVNPGITVPAAGLDKKDAHARIFSKAVRKRATSRTRTDNDVIISLHTVAAVHLLKTRR